jgi:hypothetical protein
MVQLDVQAAAHVADRDRRVETVVGQPKIVQQSQCLPREPAEFGMVPLSFQLPDDNQRQHHVVLVKPEQRPRVGQQNRRVQHISAGTGGGGSR